MDADLWPEVEDQITTLLEEPDVLTVVPAKYVLKTLKGFIGDLKKFQDDERFPQEQISKWLNTFEDWAQEAMQRKCKEDVSCTFVLFSKY